MKIAVASSDGENVDLHLGKASSLFVYEFSDDNGLEFLEYREVEIDADKKHQGTKILNACKDCDIIIAVQHGFTSKMNADDLGIKLVDDEGPMDEVLKRYIDHYNFMRS